MQRIFFMICIFLVMTCVAQTQQDTAIWLRQVDSLIDISKTLAKDKHFTEATNVIDQIESICTTSIGKESLSYAKCLRQRGGILHYQNKFTEALPFYQKSRDLCLKLAGKENKDYINTVNNMAIVYRQLNQTDLAIPLFKEVVDLKAKILGIENIDYAIALNNYANASYLAFRFEDVEKSYLEVRRIREKLLGKQHQEYARILNNLAALYVDIGRYEEAEKYYLETKSIQETTVGKTSSDYAWTLNNLGILYRKLGRFEDSESYFQQSNDIGLKAWDSKSDKYTKGLGNLAELYCVMGQYDQADKIYQNIIDISQNQIEKDIKEFAKVYNNMAVLYENKENYPNAEKYYIQAKEIIEKASGTDNIEYAWALNNLANLKVKQGKYAEGEAMLKTCLSIRETNLGKTHPDYANTLEDFSRLYTKQKQFNRALELQTNAVNLYENAFGKENLRYAINLADEAKLEGLTNNSSKAQEHLILSSNIQRNLLFKSTRFLSERELTAYSGLFLENNDINYTMALKIKPSLEFTANCFDNTLFYKGFLLNAVSRIRNLSNTNSAIASKIELLNSYQRRLISQYMLPSSQRDSSVVKELELKANNSEKELAKASSSFNNANSSINWLQISKTLKQDEVAIEFVNFHINTFEQTDSVIYAALVLKSGTNGPEFIRLFDESQLEKLIGKTNDRKTDYVNNLYSFVSRGTNSLSKPQESLFDIIWKAIEPKLQSPNPIKTIFFSTSGLLHRINLGAIPLSEDTTLGEKYHMVMLNSTRQLVSNSSTQFNNSINAAIFGGIKYDVDSIFIASLKNRLPANELAMRGNSITSIDPKLRGGNWAYLKWTEKEANSIESALKSGGFNINKFKGYDATEEAFKKLGENANSPRVIHIATHGYFFPDPKEIKSDILPVAANLEAIRVNENPMIRSGLILAGANYAWANNKPAVEGIEDGILTASEISLLNLSNTELVILSACETGLGDIKGNEGVYGLQRAFKIAGVKYLIMSLWQVPDFQTQELMTTFYGKWLQDKMTIPEAFRTAQNEMKEKYQSPYFWAGFVLVE